MAPDTSTLISHCKELSTLVQDAPWLLNDPLCRPFISHLVSVLNSAKHRGTWTTSANHDDHGESDYSLQTATEEVSSNDESDCSLQTVTEEVSSNDESRNLFGSEASAVAPKKRKPKSHDLWNDPLKVNHKSNCETGHPNCVKSQHVLQDLQANVDRLAAFYSRNTLVTVVEREMRNGDDPLIPIFKRSRKPNDSDRIMIGLASLLSFWNFISWFRALPGRSLNQYACLWHEDWALVRNGVLLGHRVALLESQCTGAGMLAVHVQNRLKDTPHEETSCIISMLEDKAQVKSLLRSTDETVSAYAKFKRWAEDGRKACKRQRSAKVQSPFEPKRLALTSKHDVPLPHAERGLQQPESSLPSATRQSKTDNNLRSGLPPSRAQTASQPFPPAQTAVHFGLPRSFPQECEGHRQYWPNQHQQAPTVPQLKDYCDIWSDHQQQQQQQSLPPAAPSSLSLRHLENCGSWSDQQQQPNLLPPPAASGTQALLEDYCDRWPEEQQQQQKQQQQSLSPAASSSLALQYPESCASWPDQQQQPNLLTSPTASGTSAILKDYCDPWPEYQQQQQQHPQQQQQQQLSYWPEPQSLSLLDLHSLADCCDPWPDQSQHTLPLSDPTILPEDGDSLPNSRRVKVNSESHRIASGYENAIGNYDAAVEWQQHHHLQPPTLGFVLA